MKQQTDIILTVLLMVVMTYIGVQDGLSIYEALLSQIALLFVGVLFSKSNRVKS